MRREVSITIAEEGRDKGKIFLLREMPAEQAESWGLRLLLALAKGGADVPEDFFAYGMAGVAAFGMRAISGIQWAEARELLAEMFQCVMRQPDTHHLEVVRPLVENDIEEVATRLKLREELIILHTGFSLAAHASTLFNKLGAAVQEPATLTSH